MTEFVTWLYKWRQYSEANNTTFLTTETFKALSHTINAMVYIIHDLLNNNILDYILLGKFKQIIWNLDLGNTGNYQAVIIWYQLQR